jgi:cytochrome c peroxidase
MFEKENTEAGCQQCHARDRVTQGAETLNLGRDLFSQRGCMGCHRYEGFDRETDSLAPRAKISQLEDQITANEKQIAQDENSESRRTSDEKRQKTAGPRRKLRSDEQSAGGAYRSVEPAVEVPDAGSEEGWTKPERTFA